MYSIMFLYMYLNTLTIPKRYLILIALSFYATQKITVEINKSFITSSFPYKLKEAIKVSVSLLNYMYVSVK